MSSKESGGSGAGAEQTDADQQTQSSGVRDGTSPTYEDLVDEIEVTISEGDSVYGTRYEVELVVPFDVALTLKYIAKQSKKKCSGTLERRMDAGVRNAVIHGDESSVEETLYYHDDGWRTYIESILDRAFTSSESATKHVEAFAEVLGDAEVDVDDEE